MRLNGMTPRGALAPVVSYGTNDEAWTNFKVTITELIRESKARRIVEIGGGASPLFSPGEVEDLGLDYTVLDISQQELDRAPEGYSKVKADIAGPPEDLPQSQYEFAFSKMVAEHVGSGEQMHRNVFRILTPGGRAFHFFPTLYALPFVFNKMIPDSASSTLLEKLTPERNVAETKFPANYDWCYGPTSSQFKRFSDLGFEIERYAGFFGHNYYRRVPPLARMQRYKTELLLRYPKPALTTFSQVLLRKPGN